MMMMMLTVMAEDEDHGDPKELLKEYLKLEKEVSQTRDELKKALMACLGGGG